MYISNGDGYVYLTDAGLIDDISYTLLDCVQKEEIPEMESISEVLVENENSTDIIYKENSGYCYSDAYTYYLKDGEDYRNLDNESTEDTFASLSEFSWEECVDYYADDTELGNYGLAEPDATVSVAYEPAKEEDAEETEDSEENGEETQKFEYEVGAVDEAYYARLTGSNIVYRISEDLYQAAVNVSYEELKPDEVVLLDWDTVESIEVELDGNVYTIGLEKDDEDAYIYTLENEEIEFGDILDELSEITIAEETDDEDVPETEPALSGKRSEMSLIFHRNTESYQTVELEFYQYDGSYCISVLNGEELNYTSRTAVVDLKEAVNAVILDSSQAE